MRATVAAACLSALLGAVPAGAQDVPTSSDRAACTSFARGRETRGLLALTGLLPARRAPVGMRRWHAFVCVVRDSDGHDSLVGAFLSPSGKIACAVHGRFEGRCLTASACAATGPTTCLP